MAAGPVPCSDTGLGPWADLRREGTSLARRSAYSASIKLGNALLE
jgi:hypothetical protein